MTRRNLYASVITAGLAALLIVGSVGGALGGGRPLHDGSVPGDWSSYGGNEFNTRFNAHETAVALQNVGDLELKWFFPTLDKVTSTPVVARGLVYFGTWSGEFHALRASDGAPAWVYDAGSQVDASAAYYRGTVFFGDGEGSLHAVHADTGQLQWKREIDDDNLAHLWGSPVVYDGIVYIGTSGGDNYMDPLNVDHRCSVVALDAETGEILWRTYTAAPGTTGAGVWGTPLLVPEHGIVVVGTGNGYSHPAPPLSDAVVAMDLQSGEIVWAMQATENDAWGVLNPTDPDSDFGDTPKLVNLGTDAEPEYAIGIGQKSGDYWLLDAENGDVLWREKFSEGSIHGGFLGAGAAAYGRFYAMMFNPPGDPQGEFTLSKTVAFSQHDGDLEWSQPRLGAASAPVAVAGGILYSGDGGGLFNAYHALTGELLWTFPIGTELSGGPSVAHGHVYIGGGGGYSATALGVYAFGLPDA